MKKDTLTSMIKESIIMLDGAMGTMLQTLGIKTGICPEILNIDAPEKVACIHKAYINAGADIIETNTFGANRIKLKEYGFQNRVKELNEAGITLARKASNGNTLVAASVGPTGMMIEPLGQLTFDEAIDIFEEQISAQFQAGADIIIIETMSDIKEIRAAVIAAKNVSNLPVFASMTFEKTGRTLCGTPPICAAITLESLGVDIIGANCGVGPKHMLKIAEELVTSTSKPLFIQTNAGIPQLVNGKTVFPESPESMAEFAVKLANMGINIIGGCCGTTPEHLRAMKKALTGKKPVKREETDFLRICSRTIYAQAGKGLPLMVVGERINPTGKKKMTEELQSKRFDIIKEEALKQTKNGSHALDINIGAVGIEQEKIIGNVICAIQGVSNLPIFIDTRIPKALENALKSVDGKPIINSVTGEEKSMETVLPLAKKYGAGILILTIDEDGIPETPKKRLKIAEGVLNKALDMGFAKKDIMIDCVTLAVSANPKWASISLESIRLISKNLCVPVLLGLTNISYGLPERPLLNRVFLAMAVEAGMDAVIFDPADMDMWDTLKAAELYTGRDPDAKAYIKRFSSVKKREKFVKEREELSIEDTIIKGVINGIRDGITASIENAYKKGYTPMEIINKFLISGLNEIGNMYEQGECFLPEIIGAAETVQIAFECLKGFMKKGEIKPRASIVLATVKGDIHDIGKNIVGTILASNGYRVFDLGKNVETEDIINFAKQNKVDIIGLSALMTTTAITMAETVKTIKNAKIDIPIIVGGAVITPEYAEEIGADSYARDALHAVQVLNAMFEEKGKKER